MRDERDMSLQMPCPGKAAVFTTDAAVIPVTVAGLVCLRLHDDHGYIDFELRPGLVSPEDR